MQLLKTTAFCLYSIDFYHYPLLFLMHCWLFNITLQWHNAFTCYASQRLPHFWNIGQRSEYSTVTREYISRMLLLYFWEILQILHSQHLVFFYWLQMQIFQVFMCRSAKAILDPLLCAMTVLGFESICFHKNVSIHDRDFR